MKAYHNNNKITLDDNSEIENFDWWLSEFHHNYETSTSHGTVVMESGGFKHSRLYSIANPATYVEQALLNELLKLPEFTGSTLNT